MGTSPNISSKVATPSSHKCVTAPTRARSASRSRRPHGERRTNYWAAGFFAAAAVPLAIGMALGAGSTTAAAATPTVPLATAANYSVLAASTVTNTGNSTLEGSLGLWPGTSIVGFPPGLVLPPATTDTTNAAAQQAESDLTAAYVDAAARPVDATTTADLANLSLGAGVYSGPSKSALQLTGPLTLDGGGDPSSVFIFQTDSSLTTGSASTVTLINGAQECNVFWVVGSSATLGTSSVFAGNILALTSITVTNSVTVHGRALARNGAVTLDNDTFTAPTCAQGGGVTTTTTNTDTTSTDTGGGGTTSVAPTGGTGSVPATTQGPTTTFFPFNVTLPNTGSPVKPSTAWGALALVAAGMAAMRIARRRPSTQR